MGVILRKTTLEGSMGTGSAAICGHLAVKSATTRWMASGSVRTSHMDRQEGPTRWFIQGCTHTAMRSGEP